MDVNKMNIISIRNMNDEIATPTNRRMKIEFKSIKVSFFILDSTGTVNWFSIIL